MAWVFLFEDNTNLDKTNFALGAAKEISQTADVEGVLLFDGRCCIQIGREGELSEGKRNEFDGPAAPRAVDCERVAEWLAKALVFGKLPGLLINVLDLQMTGDDSRGDWKSTYGRRLHRAILAEDINATVRTIVHSRTVNSGNSDQVAQAFGINENCVFDRSAGVNRLVRRVSELVADG